MKTFLKLQLFENWHYLIYISLIWIISSFIINPIGDFPLNDDWAYASDVYNLSELGVFKLSDWPAMNLIAQTLWGVVISKIFGFSFTTLRLSVLFIGFLGSVLFFLSTRKYTQNAQLAFILTLILIFNPLYFSLSFTFMTDVTFIVMLLLSFYFYVEYFSKPVIRNILIATLFALIATMIRQLGVYIGIAALITYLLSFKPKRKEVTILIATAFIPILASTLYNLVLTIFDLQPAGHLTFSDVFRTIISGEAFNSFGYRYSTIFFFYGFTLFPATILFFPSFWINTKNTIKWIFVIISVLLSLIIISHLNEIFAGNVFYNLGLGPKTLKDTYSGFNTDPVFSRINHTIFNIAGLTGTFFLFFAVFISILRINIKCKTVLDKVKIFSLVLILGYAGFLFVDINFFDRYFLMVVPFILLFVIPEKLVILKFFSIVSIVAAILIGLFCILATHDYFSWNKARWIAINDLLKEGVSPKKIDGGFEFNGWYATSTQHKKTILGKSWWFVDDDEYVITFGNYCGYDQLRAYKFKNLLTFREDTLYILKRYEKDTLSIFFDAEKINNSIFPTSDSTIIIENNINRNNSESHSGNYSGMLDKEYQFGFTTRFNDVQPCEGYIIKLWHKNVRDKVFVVVSDSTASKLYIAQNIEKNDNQSWQYSEFQFMIPDDYSSGEIGIYVWNPSGNTIFIDDLSIQRIKRALQ